MQTDLTLGTYVLLSTRWGGEYNLPAWPVMKLVAAVPGRVVVEGPGLVLQAYSLDHVLASGELLAMEARQAELVADWDRSAQAEAVRKLLVGHMLECQL